MSLSKSHMCDTFALPPAGEGNGMGADARGNAERRWIRAEKESEA
jgi:hypothetical protein